MNNRATFSVYLFLAMLLLASCAPLPVTQLRPGAASTIRPGRDGCGGSKALSGKMSSFKKLGVSLRYYTCLAGSLRATVADGVAVEEAAGFDQMVIPAHLVITFVEPYTGQQMLYRQAAAFEARPRIEIYPTAAYAAFNDLARREIEDLQRVLQERPSSFPGGAPFLPTVNASRMLHARPVYVDFANGSGLRYLTQVAQESRPVNNQELFYTFQGLTSDGAYYVAAFFPVRTPYLPETADQVASSIDGPAYAPYLEKTTRELNDLLPADFSPHLFLLDAVIASLEVAPEAALPVLEETPQGRETPASPLVAPPDGLVYAAGDGLWRIAPGGRAERLLPLTGYRALLPSPDVTFAAFLDGDGLLWLADLVTGSVRPLAPAATPAGLYGWTDEQTLLLGVQQDSDEGQGDGTGQLARLDITGGALELLDEQFVSLGLPAPMPRGGAIAYDVSPYESGVTTGGWLYLPGSGLAPFAWNAFSGLPETPPYHLSNPTWSPDGRQIVWRWQSAEGVNSLILFDLLRREALNLFAWQPRGFGAVPPSPVWSPQGAWLAVEIWAAGEETSGLWLLRADGGAAWRLPAGSNPHWLDEQRLIYAACDGNQICSNVVYDLAGKTTQRLDMPQGTILQLPLPAAPDGCTGQDEAWLLREDRQGTADPCLVAAELLCPEADSYVAACWFNLAPTSATRGVEPR